MCVCACVCVWCFHTYVCTFVACVDVKGHWALCFISLPYSLRQGPSLNSELHYRQSHDFSYLKSLQFWDYRVHGTYLLFKSVFKCKQSYPLNNFLSTLIPSHSQFDSHWFRHILLLPTVLPIIIF